MKILIKIRIILGMFVVLLLLSGITAFPVRTEIAFLVKHIAAFPQLLQEWILQLDGVISQTPDIMLYGTDWLAFAHIIISMFFIPVFMDPVKHKANLIIGMMACIAVFPLAFICGPIRGIPFFHQLIDCCFGVGGIILLLYVYRQSQKLETNNLFKK
ncbi:MAG: hypothetical protein K0S32_3974 [Bacteroidetes bacterium]|nr:hypothetical protein [Bacteroidota bacterium]